MQLVSRFNETQLPFIYPLRNAISHQKYIKSSSNLQDYLFISSEYSHAPHYSLVEKEDKIIEDILKSFPYFQSDLFWEKIKKRIITILNIDELKEEKIIPSKQSFFSLLSFLSNKKNFCEKYHISVFISPEGYASIQYINTNQNHFFNIKFINETILSYIIINKNTPLFRMEREATKESFFKNLEESRICIE